MTLTTTVALGSPQCNCVGYRRWCFCFFCLQEEKPTNEQKKKEDTVRRQLTAQETKKEDKTQQGNNRVEEKLREKDSLQEQINSDFLFVSLKPAKFQQ